MIKASRQVNTQFCPFISMFPTVLLHCFTTHRVHEIGHGQDPCGSSPPKLLNRILSSTEKMASNQSFQSVNHFIMWLSLCPLQAGTSQPQQRYARETPFSKTWDSSKKTFKAEMWPKCEYFHSPSHVENTALLLSHEKQC